MREDEIMKKGYDHYFGIWFSLFALFNGVAIFLICAGAESYAQPAFWIGYGLVDLSFLGQVLCTAMAIRAKSMQKLFYNLPLIRISYLALIVSFLTGGAFMVLLPGAYWTCGLVSLAILVLEAVAVLKATAAAELIEAVDQKTEAQTRSIRSLTAMAGSLASRAEGDQIREVCTQVYEALRYSDPVSTRELAAVEEQIEDSLQSLTAAVDRGEVAAVRNEAKKLLASIEERAQLCKLGK